MNVFVVILFWFSVTDDLKNLVIKLETRVSQLEKGGSGSAAPAATPAPAKVEEDEEDEDVDLFGSDSEDEEAKAEKVRHYNQAYPIHKKHLLIHFNFTNFLKLCIIF